MKLQPQPAENSLDAAIVHWILRWLFPPLLLLVTVSCIGWGIGDWLRESAFERHGKTTLALVLQAGETSKRSGAGYRALVSFETEDGRPIETWVPLSRAVGQTIFESGQQVQAPVVYLPDSPYVAKGADTGSDAKQELLLGIVGLGVFCGDMWLRWRRRQRSA